MGTQYGSISFNEDVTNDTRYGRIGIYAGLDQFVVEDQRVVPTGLEYFADYSATFALESLVTKRYVDSRVTSALSFQGTRDASLGTLPTARPVAPFTIQPGDAFVISVAGTIT